MRRITRIWILWSMQIRSIRRIRSIRVALTSDLLTHVGPFDLPLFAGSECL